MSSQNTTLETILSPKNYEYDPLEAPKWYKIDSSEIIYPRKDHKLNLLGAGKSTYESGRITYDSTKSILDKIKTNDIIESEKITNENHLEVD